MSRGRKDSPDMPSRRRNCFLCFMRRFWNQVFTWVSLSPSADASSTRSGVDRYLLGYGQYIPKINNIFYIFHTASFIIMSSYLWASKRFSKPVSCGSLKTVLAFRRRQWRNAFTPIPMLSASSDETPQPPFENRWWPPPKIPAEHYWLSY